MAIKKDNPNDQATPIPAGSIERTAKNNLLKEEADLNKVKSKKEKGKKSA